MSDSIDRVFVKAISTIRSLSSLPNTLPRPPQEVRIRLYGLYKQATEGNVEGIMDRPTGDRDEDEAAKRKWDAWKSHHNVAKTESKRLYITLLIHTMKTYALGSHNARELLNELEYLWDQVKDVEVTPPMTPMDTSVYGGVSGYGYGGSIYGGPAGYPMDEVREMRLLKKEVADSLKRLEESKTRQRKDEWDGVKRVARFLLRLLGSVVKRMVLDIVVLVVFVRLAKMDPQTSQRVVRWFGVKLTLD